MVDALTRLKQPERVARLRGKQMSDIISDTRHQRSTMERRPQPPKAEAAVAAPAPEAAPAETPAARPETPPAAVPEG